MKSLLNFKTFSIIMKTRTTKLMKSKTKKIRPSDIRKFRVSTLYFNDTYNYEQQFSISLLKIAQIKDKGNDLLIICT